MAFKKYDTIEERKHRVIEIAAKYNMTPLFPKNFKRIWTGLISYKCNDCGAIKGPMEMDQFVRCPTCKPCGYKKRDARNQEKRRLRNIKIIEGVLKARPNAECLSAPTGATNERVTFKCEHGHIFEGHVHYMKIKPTTNKKYNQWCPICAKDKKVGNALRRYYASLPYIDQLDENVKYQRSHRYGIEHLSREFLYFGLNLIETEIDPNESHPYNAICEICGNQVSLKHTELHKLMNLKEKGCPCSPTCTKIWRQKTPMLDQIFEEKDL